MPRLIEDTRAIRTQRLVSLLEIGRSNGDCRSKSTCRCVIKISSGREPRRSKNRGALVHAREQASLLPAICRRWSERRRRGRRWCSKPGLRAGSVLAFELLGFGGCALLESRFSQEPRVRSVRAAPGQRSAHDAIFRRARSQAKAAPSYRDLVKTQGRVRDTSRCSDDSNEDAMRQMGFLRIASRRAHRSTPRGSICKLCAERGGDTLARGGVDIIPVRVQSRVAASHATRCTVPTHCSSLLGIKYSC